MPAKAATIIQFKDAIARQRQESWATLIIGPLPKLVTTMDGNQDPVDDLPILEPGVASIRDEVLIRQVVWTNRTKESTENTSSDFTQIDISVCRSRGRRFGVWNLYNAPANSIRAGDSLKSLLEAPGFPDFVAGDFNLRHRIFDSFTTSTSQEATDLIDQGREKDLILLNLTNVSTQSRGSTLDLAFCSQIDANCEAPLDLHTTSDHETLLTTIPLYGAVSQETRG
ncbi:hypothetical protein EPUL_002656 [Erysiphe pulchra]|uniref:Endonuclease/exonuclease/phosphatase domain-containing protein n=1 Tax=Erysiphe pulchra TaxID=225359 RepID=A0A2S4PW03_9PEZI|nr:hypothetical protein EPUL_002656 [Erysiphe pulchra]